MQFVTNISLPSTCICTRKTRSALDFIWSYRSYFTGRSDIRIHIL